MFLIAKQMAEDGQDVVSVDSLRNKMNGKVIVDSDVIKRSWKE